MAILKFIDANIIFPFLIKAPFFVLSKKITIEICFQRVLWTFGVQITILSDVFASPLLLCISFTLIL